MGADSEQGGAAKSSVRKPPTRGERRRNRTRDLLLKAARAVIERAGIEATTIQSITDEADIGFGTFYYHFKSKEEIVEAVVVSCIKEIDVPIRKLVANQADPALVVARAFRTMIARVSENAVLRDWVPMADARAGPLRDLALALLTRDLSAGVQGGRFRVPDVETAALGVVALIQGYFRYRDIPQLAAVTPDSLAALMLGMLGVTPDEISELVFRAAEP